MTEKSSVIELEQAKPQRDALSIAKAFFNLFIQFVLTILFFVRKVVIFALKVGWKIGWIFARLMIRLTAMTLRHL